MNSEILQEYQISFRVLVVDGEKEFDIVQKEITNLNYCLASFLSNRPPYTEFLEYELLPEIEKAIQNQSFDSDGGGDGVYLEIDYPNSTFTSGGGPYKITPTIPTEDLKEIILSWVEFLKNNS